jgi:hypothetical protein
MESKIKRTRRILKDLEKTTSDRRAWIDVVVNLYAFREPKSDEEGTRERL